MTTYSERLKEAHDKAQRGVISPGMYRFLERQIVREAKAANRRRYGFAMKLSERGQTV